MDWNLSVLSTSQGNWQSAIYRHSGFQALGDLALLTSDQPGSDGLALGRPATACLPQRPLQNTSHQQACHTRGWRRDVR